MAEDVRGRWQNAGFSLGEALQWIRSGVTDPMDALRKTNAGIQPGTQHIPEKPPVEKPKVKPPKKFYSTDVVINVRDILLYQPYPDLHFSSNKGATRQKELQDLSTQFGIDIVAVILGFARYLSDLIRAKIKNYVNSQMVISKPMKLVYKPLNEAYNRSKPARNRGKFWKNSDFLIQNLRIWRYRSSVFLGYPPKVIHPKTFGRKHPVSAQKIMSWVENGTRKMPARPLIKPIFDDVSKHLDGYFARFLALVRGRDKVAMHWLK